MLGRLKVVDASVLGALLFGEPRAEQAAALLEGGSLVAPTLLRYELASIALKKLREHPEHREALLDVLPAVERLGVRLVDVDAAAVVRLAERERITAYDAAYVWVAREMEAELVTFDGPLRKRLARPRSKTRPKGR